MIQRIQSVYLALAILSVALMFAFKIAEVPATEAHAVLTIYGAEQADQSLETPLLALPPYVFNIVIIVLLIASLLMYKNRKQQLMMGRVSYILILGYFVYLYFAVDSVSGAIEGAERIVYGAGIYFPIAALAFVFLANRAIKKDEALVRSLDRLR